MHIYTEENNAKFYIKYTYKGASHLKFYSFKQTLLKDIHQCCRYSFFFFFFWGGGEILGFLEAF